MLGGRGDEGRPFLFCAYHLSHIICDSIQRVSTDTRTALQVRHEQASAGEQFLQTVYLTIPLCS